MVMASDTLVTAVALDIAVLLAMGVSNSQFQQQIATKVALHLKFMTQTFLQLLIDFAAVISECERATHKKNNHDATGYAGSYSGE